MSTRLFLKKVNIFAVMAKNDSPWSFHYFAKKCKKKNFIIIDIKYINNSQIVLFADMTNGIFLFIHIYCLISINDKN